MKMTDWNAIAQARNLDIPPEEVAEFAPVLQALEESIGRLAEQLRYSDKP